MMPFLAALLAFALLSGAAHADALPAVLRRGINITNWFRFPPSRDPAALRGYLDDTAMGGLRRAGFTFVRLPVQPELLAAPGVPAALVEAVARLERHGLAVIVTLHPGDWHLETVAGDRARLVAFWRSTAPLLRRFDPAMTFPEVLNEPVFADGRMVGHTTSGAYGHTLGAAIALGYVRDLGGDIAGLVGSARFEIEVAGRRIGATASLAPMYDPKSLRIKA